jgi:outer membrane biosynthesis protein TonB
LFQLVGGRYFLNLTEGMDARLSDGGQAQTLSQLKAQGQVRQVSGGWQVILNESARGRIVLGDMKLLFQYVMAPPLQPRPQLPHSVRGSLADRIDPYMAIIMVLSFIFHGALGIYVYYMDVPAPPPPDEIPDRFAKALLDKPPILEKPKLVTQTGTAPVAETGKPGGDEGKDKEPKGGGDDKKKGGGPEAPPDQAAVAQAVQNTAVLKVLGARSRDGSGSFVDVTGGKDPGGDLSKGLQNVGKSGAAVALTGGGSGLGGGTRGPATGEIGTGKYTGAVGPSGGGNVGGAKGEEEIKADVSSGRLEDIDAGGLDPSKVASRIKSQYFRGVKQCYERALKANPKLQGKVEVSFVVGPAGNVTKVSVDGFDPGVDQCIQGQARNWRFDKPEEGSAEFSIPFILRPGN